MRQVKTDSPGAKVANATAYGLGIDGGGFEPTEVPRLRGGASALGSGKAAPPLVFFICLEDNFFGLGFAAIGFSFFGRPGSLAIRHFRTLFQSKFTLWHVF